jgi:hypothetical protein
MLIPTGVHYLATAQEIIWKIVPCERCSATYGYRLEVTGTGFGSSTLFLNTEGAKRDAALAAQANLLLKAESSVAPVPCPLCGWYQRSMVRSLHRNKIHWTQIVGGILLACAPSPLLLENPLAWLPATVLAVSGGGLLVAGWFIVRSMDPNAGNPEPRKELGRSLAVWGEALERLVRESQPG